MADEIERIITIPMRATKMVPRTKRAERAVKEVRDNIVRHMKVDPEDVWIDKSLNEKIWEKGIQNPPRKITVKAVKFDDGLVEVSLVGAESSGRGAKKKSEQPAEEPVAAIEAPKEEVTEETPEEGEEIPEEDEVIDEIPEEEVIDEIPEEEKAPKTKTKETSKKSSPAKKSKEAPKTKTKETSKKSSPAKKSKEAPKEEKKKKKE